MKNSDVIELIRITIEMTLRNRTPWLYALNRINPDSISSENYKKIHNVYDPDKKWNHFISDLCDLIDNLDRA